MVARLAGNGAKVRPEVSTTAADLATVRDALIVLSGHLPHFSDDPRKRRRAAEHARLEDEAFAALDRIADELGVTRVRRVTLYRTEEASPSPA